MQSVSPGLNDSVALTPLPSTTVGHYRQRESTQYRGVTKTSGTNSGVEKFDVQFVFCDSGTKKHPKIYGFSSAQSAARAFDILTCKRALEKNRSVATVMGSAQALGTNHPTTDYSNEPLLTLLNTNSRDDIIYALKQCAKRGHGLDPNNLIAELKLGLEAARAEAAEKERMGDTRQSYEPTAKPSSERKRKPSAASGSSHRLPPLNQSISSRQQAAAQQAAAAAAATVAVQQQQEDQLMALMSSLPYGASQQKGRQGSMVAQTDELHASLHTQQASQLLNSSDVAGLAALAAGLLCSAPNDPNASRAAARLAAAAVDATRPAPPDLRIPAVHSMGLGSLSGMLQPLAGTAPSGGTQSQQLMLLQMLQAQVGSGQQQARENSSLRAQVIKSEPVAGQGVGLEGKDFLLECIRLGMASSPELSCAHDLVRIWACLMQGKAWANDQYNLPQWYYMGLVPHLQACSTLSALLAFCGLLWQAGALRVMLAAFAGNLPQPTVITLLQSVAAAAGQTVPPAASSPPQGAGLKQQQQDQATALLAAALQQVQQHEREQQHLGTLKAAAALLGAAPQLSTAGMPGTDGAGPALLQQVLHMLGGSVAGPAGADGQLNASQERLVPATNGLGEAQPHLLQLLQLLGGATGAGAAGAAEAPTAGAAVANPGRRSTGPTAAAGGAGKAGQLSSPSRREGSPSTETDGSSNGAAEEASAAPGAGEAEVNEAAGAKPSVDAAVGKAEAEEAPKEEEQASPVPPAKKVRTGVLSEADAAALAAAADALGINGKVSPSSGRAPPTGPPFRSVRLDSGTGMPAPSAHPFAALAAAVGAAAAAAGAAAGGGPTRPQPLKAGSRELPNGGSALAASFGGASIGAQLLFGNKSWAPGASVGGGTNGSKLDLLSKAASLDVQHSSAFSRFQQQQKAAAAAAATPPPA